MQVTKGDHVYKFLGLVITNSLSWKDHLTQLTPKVCTACYVLRCIRPFMSQNTLKSVPWQASSPDTWTGFEIKYYLLNLFIPPLLPVPKPGPLSPTLVISSEPSTSKTVEPVSAVQPQPELSYSATVFVQSLKYGVCNKYVRLLSSEQEFCVAQGTCG